MSSCKYPCLKKKDKMLALFIDKNVAVLLYVGSKVIFFNDKKPLILVQESEWVLCSEVTFKNISISVEDNEHYDFVRESLLNTGLDYHQFFRCDHAEFIVNSDEGIVHNDEVYGLCVRSSSLRKLTIPHPSKIDYICELLEKFKK